MDSSSDQLRTASLAQIKVAKIKSAVISLIASLSPNTYIYLQKYTQCNQVPSSNEK